MRTCKQCGNSESVGHKFDCSSETFDDVVLSAAAAALTDSAIVGAVIGGSIGGAILGDLLDGDLMD